MCFNLGKILNGYYYCDFLFWLIKIYIWIILNLLDKLTSKEYCYFLNTYALHVKKYKMYWLHTKLLTIHHSLFLN